MVLYFVSWIPDPKLCKGKGRLSGDELYIMFSVFHPRYLMLKAMDMPISLIDSVSSLIRYSKKYSSPRL